MMPVSALNLTPMPDVITYDPYTGDVPEPVQVQEPGHILPPDPGVNHNKVSRDKRKTKRKAQKLARRAGR